MVGVFSSTNRITKERFLEAYKKSGSYGLCKGAYGTQSDCQCVGYDCLCGLAIMLYNMEGRDRSYRAVSSARDEVRDSMYSQGFQHGWDDRCEKSAEPEYTLGYEDGAVISRTLQWEGVKPNDYVGR